MGKFKNTALVLCLLICYSKSCGTNCVSCDSTNSCTQCKQGYSLVTGQCSKIETEFCTQIDFERNCVACASGYLLQNGHCKICQVPGCMDCSANIATCVTCYPGLFFNGQNCLTSCAVDNCGECQANVNQCTQCLDGHRLINNNASCEKCSIDNCTRCNISARICTECAKDYFLDGEICTLCPFGCADCADATKCNRCDEDFKFYMDQNQKCLGRAWVLKVGISIGILVAFF